MNCVHINGGWLKMLAQLKVLIIILLVYEDSHHA